jgi:hypothetical protein
LKPYRSPSAYTSASVRARRVWILVCALALALGLGACGQESQPSSSVNDGVYVDAGPITYQMQISRQLNQYATEDSQYLAGLPAGQGTLTPSQLWYGVFLWAKNQTDQAHATADTFTIVDTTGDTYHPIPLNAELNAYAWTSQILQPSMVEPAPNTTASFGPTQGGLILFKLPTGVYSDRPLTLNIIPPSGKPAAISLDL